MKKLMSVMLGLGFLAGTTLPMFAQDANQDSTKMEKKASKKHHHAKKAKKAKTAPETK